MKKRILTLLAAVCLLSAVLSGCGDGSAEQTPCPVIQKKMGGD